MTTTPAAEAHPSAVAEGTAAARKCGADPQHPEGANPYPPGSDQFKAWNWGWNKEGSRIDYEKRQKQEMEESLAWNFEHR